MDSRSAILITDDYAYAAQFERNRGDWSCCRRRVCSVEAPVLPRTANALVPLGKTVAAGLRLDFPTAERWRLVIPASWCLCHAVWLPSRRWSDQAALFEFEQFIPIELERLTCATLRSGTEQGFVAGVFTDALRGLLDTFETESIFVDSIGVDALIAAGTVGANDENTIQIELADRGRRSVVTAGRAVLDVRTFVTSVDDESSAIVWDHHGRTDREIADRPHQHQWCLTECGEANDAEGNGHRTDHARDNGADHLLRAAATQPVIVDLRIGALAPPGRFESLRKRMTDCGVALIVLLAATAIHTRTEQAFVQAALDDLRLAREQTYRTVYPERPVPPGVALHLRSDRIRMERLTDLRTPGTADLGPSGLETLERLNRIVQAMPAAIKLDVDEISAENHTVRIRGRTTGHSAAGEIVKALNTISSLSAAPPRTKLRSDGTVDFQIEIQRSDDASE